MKTSKVKMTEDQFIKELKKANGNGAKLPRHIVVESKVDIHGFEYVFSLPDDLTIKGYFDTRWCENLHFLPRNLTIRGHLISMGSGLEALPDTLNVKYNIVLADCKRLKYIPNNFVAKNSLDLRWCELLNELPNGLVVKNSLALHGSGIRSLPNDLKVRNISIDSWMKVPSTVKCRICFIDDVGVPKSILFKTLSLRTFERLTVEQRQTAMRYLGTKWAKDNALLGTQWLKDNGLEENLPYRP